MTWAAVSTRKYYVLPQPKLSLPVMSLHKSLLLCNMYIHTLSNYVNLVVDTDDGTTFLAQR